MSRVQRSRSPRPGGGEYGTLYAAGTLLRKMFSNGNKVEYRHDTLKRLNRVERWKSGAGTADPCTTLDLQYDVLWQLTPEGSKPANRLTTRTWGNANTAVCPAGQIQEKLSYTAAGLVLGKQMLIARGSNVYDLTAYWTYTEGRKTDERYPLPWQGSGTWHPEFQFGFGHDHMYRETGVQWWGRSNAIGHPLTSVQVAENALYNAAGQMTNLSITGGITESRQYNNLGQLTQIVGVDAGTQWVGLDYFYSATANDGRVTALWDSSTLKDPNTGALSAVNEAVDYHYDALKRLVKAATQGPQWGMQFGYDGFGNLLSHTVTKGTALQFSLGVNPANNRIGSHTYDAAGNVLNDGIRAYGWDAENRLEAVGGTKKYSYDPENLRVYDGTAYYFYAPDGRRLGRYTINGANVIQTDEVYVWLAGRMVARGKATTSGVRFYAQLTDRTGSVRLKAM